MKKSILFFACVVSAFAADYHQDLQLLSGVALATDTTTSEFTLRADYSGAVNFNESISMPLGFQAVMANPINGDNTSPVQVLTYPKTYDFLGGLEYGTDELSIRGHGLVRMNFENNEVVIPGLDGFLKERYRVGVFLSGAKQGETVDFGASARYAIRNQAFESTVDEEFSKDNHFESDLWYTANSSFHLNKEFDIAARYNGKSELSSTTTDNDFHQLYLGLDANKKLSKKAYIYGDLYSRYYLSQSMVDKAYLGEDNKGALGVSSHIRGMFKVHKKLWIKGDFLGDFSSQMQKMRYEVAARGVFRRDGTMALQTGYWITPNSLFPRQCSYLTGTIGLSEVIFLEPEAKMYWQWDDETFEFYRTDIGMDLQVKIPASTKVFKTMRIVGGAEYRLFEEEHFYPTSLNLYAGVKTFL